MKFDDRHAAFMTISGRFFCTKTRLTLMYRFKTDRGSNWKYLKPSLSNFVVYEYRIRVILFNATYRENKKRKVQSQHYLIHLSIIR